MSAVPAIATQLRSCGKSRASSYYVLEKRRSPAPPPPVPRRRRALKLRRGQDRATGPGLDQHSAFETVRRVAGQNDHLWCTGPAADADELTHDVAMRNGAAAILTGADRNLNGPWIVADQPDVGATARRVSRPDG